MANWRDYYLASSQSVTDSGSYTWQIPPGLKITDIDIVYSSTNGATSNTVGKICGMVSSIQVLNGSDVLASLSGTEAQAYFAFNGRSDNAKFPRKILTAAAAGVVYESFPLLFGRFYRDPLYYLDTSRYSSPQIRVNHAVTISATAGFATGTTTVTIILHLIDSNAPPYAGFMMVKELAQFQSSASGIYSQELPLDWPYAALMVQALKTTVDPTTILTNFKLTANYDGYIPYNNAAADVAAQNLHQYGRQFEEFVPLSDTTFTWLSDVYYKSSAWPAIAGATGKMNISSVTGESVVGTFTTGQAAGTMKVEVNGGCPQACFYLPIGDGDTPTDYLNPTQGINDLRLLLTQGVASAACTVVTAQLRQ